jgi:hypothetical protein
MKLTDRGFHVGFEIFDNIGRANRFLAKRTNVQELINYLQNWVDTGNFEGKKEAESND